MLYPGADRRSILVVQFPIDVRLFQQNGKHIRLDITKMRVPFEQNSRVPQQRCALRSFTVNGFAFQKGRQQHCDVPQFNRNGSYTKTCTMKHSMLSLQAPLRATFQIVGRLCKLRVLAFQSCVGSLQERMVPLKVRTRLPTVVGLQTRADTWLPPPRSNIDSIHALAVGNILDSMLGTKFNF